MLQAKPLHFRVNLAPDVGDAPQTGRLIVLMTTRPDMPDEVEPALDETSGSFGAREVRNWRRRAIVETNSQVGTTSPLAEPGHLIEQLLNDLRIRIQPVYLSGDSCRYRRGGTDPRPGTRVDRALKEMYALARNAK